MWWFFLLSGGTIIAVAYLCSDRIGALSLRRVSAAFTDRSCAALLRCSKAVCAMRNLRSDAPPGENARVVSSWLTCIPHGSSKTSAACCSSLHSCMGLPTAGRVAAIKLLISTSDVSTNA